MSSNLIPDYTRKHRGVQRLLRACGHSWSGLAVAWRHESAFRQEFAGFLCLLPVFFLIDFNSVERIMLLGSMVLVLIVELLNSAIEAVVDRIGYEHHDLSGQAKDLASAAVMSSLVFMAITWASLLLPKL
ncbi:MAG: diacylglycerol kinase [Haliea sp.]|uniref:diacylglycerol kinase n=1 Tax=Haliea sp. TaxID=1932666 RepID=UPI0032EC54D6